MTLPRLMRGSLRSQPANGHSVFVPQLRKLVFEFCDKWPSSANTRTFIQNQLEDVARKNPHVEFVVKMRYNKEPIVRGFYLNGRDKVIALNHSEATQIHQKVQLLLDSSGAKLKSFKRRPVESTTEATRGIWSGLHADRPRL